MAFELPKITPDFIKRNPLIAAFMLICAVAGFFVSSYVKSNDSRNSDCIEARKQDAVFYNSQIFELRVELTRKDSLLNDVYQQLLITHGIINKLPEKLDSIANKKKKVRR